jgi:ADP-heptose:LPS heptosyltransferase
MNKVLIVREIGGVGDILMQRMIFEDFKLIDPSVHLTYACPPQFHSLVKSHPFIDEVVNSKDVDRTNYQIIYDITSACSRYEIAKAPLADLHRSDIWAKHCGIKLTKHNSYLQVDEQSKEWAMKIIRNRPVVLLCPVSAMLVKNLTGNHISATVRYLKDRGYSVMISHSTPIHTFGAEMITGTTLSQLLGLIDSVDYVITVDTGQFHMAGMLNKPLTGIFTFCDGKIYGKYFNFELVQKHRDNGDWDCGPCYNWGTCKKSKDMPKPCLTQISNEMIFDGIERMFKRWEFKL